MVGFLESVGSCAEVALPCGVVFVGEVIVNGVKRKNTGLVSALLVYPLSLRV